MLSILSPAIFITNNRLDSSNVSITEEANIARKDWESLASICFKVEKKKINRKLTATHHCVILLTLKIKLAQLSLKNELNQIINGFNLEPVRFSFFLAK